MPISVSTTINEDPSCKLQIPKRRNVQDSQPNQSSKPAELKDNLPKRCGLKHDIDPEEGAIIGLDMNFDTLAMEIERNLLKELISAVKEILDNISVGSVTNIEKAVKEVADTIRKLIGSTEVVWEQRIKWDFEKILPDQPTPITAVIERTIDAKSSINSELVHFKLTVHSTVDNRQIGTDILFDNSTPRTNKSDNYNNTQRVLQVIRDKNNKVIDDIVLNLSIDGNADKVKVLLDALNDVVISAVKLVQDLTPPADDGLSLGDIVGTLSSINPTTLAAIAIAKLFGPSTPPPPPTKPVDISARVKALFSDWIKLIKTVFKTEQGDLSLNALSYKIYCINEEEKDRLLEETIQEEIPKMVEKVSDGTLKKFEVPKKIIKNLEFKQKETQ